MRRVADRGRGAPGADFAPLLARFAGARIAVVGDLVADAYVFGETERISREAPVLIVRHEREELRPGCAANAVANLCALGARVLPVGLVGDDAAGAALRARLREAGASLDGILTAPGEATATKTRILAGGKNTRRQQMLRVDRDGPRPPQGKLLTRLTGALQAAARAADAVLVSDYGGGLLAPGVVEAVLALARAGKLVCADARYQLLQYRGVAFAKPNEVELEQAVGRPIGDDPALLEEAGRELLRRLGAKALLVTRGRSGMALLRPLQPTALVPVHGPAEAVDVTGAGDTVMATCSLALACGADALGAARLANVAGALVVQKSGTATVTVQELTAELSRAPLEEPTWLGRPTSA